MRIPIRLLCRSPITGICGLLVRPIPSATRRVLTLQLNEVEQHGLISKTIYPQLPLKVEYYLTPLGDSLLSVSDTLEQWVNEHRPALKGVLETTPSVLSEAWE